jgi:hypothetical protein
MIASSRLDVERGGKSVSLAAVNSWIFLMYGRKDSLGSRGVELKGSQDARWTRRIILRIGIGSNQ